jgi:hypothetical protein
MMEKEIMVRQVSPGVLELSVPEELYNILKELADSEGKAVGAFVSDALLPVHLVDTSHSR